MDDGLVKRMRSAMARRKGVTERKMFGGVCFLLHGNMLCAASKRGFLFRVGPDGETKALTRPGAKPMEMKGRRYRGYVRVDPDLCSARQLPGWVTLAHAYVAGLPPKR
jgi:hypothetical protein